MQKLTHTDEKGRLNMVDVGHKPDRERRAVARGFITLGKETVALIKENNMKKGDVLTVAEIAGVQAAKQTGTQIPLCHLLQLTKINVRAEVQDRGVEVISEVKCNGKTGVEMEALNAVSTALLTVYDMCKAVDKNMVIKEILLVKKVKMDILIENGGQ